MLLTLIAPMVAPLPANTAQEVRQGKSPIDAGPRVVQVHDVSRWTGHLRAIELLSIMRGIDGSPEERATAFEDYNQLLEDDSPRQRAESLARTLQFVLEPELGQDFAEFTACDDGSALLVMASAPHQLVITQTLGDLSSDSRLVDVSAFVIRVPEADLAPLMGGMSTLTLSPAQLEDFEEKLDGANAAKLTSPRVLLAPMSPAEIFIGNEVAYIADYESTSIPDLSQEIADPVISTLRDGESLSVRAAPVGDMLRLRVRFESSHLVRPMALETMRIGSGGFEVQVQRPELKSVNATATFDVVKGSAVVLGTVDETGDAKAPSGVIVIVKAELVEPPKEGPRAPEPEKRKPK